MRIQFRVWFLFVLEDDGIQNIGTFVSYTLFYTFNDRYQFKSKLIPKIERIEGKNHTFPLCADTTFQFITLKTFKSTKFESVLYLLVSTERV